MTTESAVSQSSTADGTTPARRCDLKIEPMKKVVRMLRAYRARLLNWFRAKGQLSSGLVEGSNAKTKLTSRKSFGFRTYHAMEIALHHALGALPEPESTHKFRRGAKMRKGALLTKEEFSRFLRELSSDIERGELSFDYIKEKIPPNLDVEYKYKNKKGFKKFKISFKWTSDRRSDKSSTFISSRSNATSFKGAKIQLAGALDDISKVISKNRIPTDKQVEDLLSITEASIELSKPELKQGMAEVKTATIELKQAVSDNSVVRAESVLNYLKQLRSEFHKKYK